MEYLKTRGKTINASVFKSMINEGCTALDISKEFKISRPTVMKLAKQVDLYDKLRASGKKKHVEHCQTIRIKIGDHNE